MANRLRKHVEVEVLTEAKPARPAIPDRVEVRTVRVQVGNRRVCKTSSFSTPGSGTTSITSCRVIPVYELIKKTYVTPGSPYVPAAPAVVLTRGANAWDGGARSIEPQLGDLNFAFTFPPGPLGVICGLANGAKVRAYDHVAYGFIAQKGQPLSIIESGRIIMALAWVDLLTKPRLSVRRTSGTVSYLVDGEVQYTSQRETRDVVYAEAALYSVADYVDDPVFEPLSNGGVSGRVPPPLGTIGAGSYAYVDGFVPIPQLSALASERFGVSGLLPIPTPTIYDAPYAVVGGRIPAPRGSARGAGELIGVASVGGVVPGISARMRVLEGFVATVDAILPRPIGLISESDLAQVLGSVPAPRIMGSFEMMDTPTRINANDPVVLGDYAIIDYPLMIATLDGVGVVSTLELTLVAQASVMDALNIGDSVAMSGSLFASLFESLHIVTDIGSARRTGTEYAVNITSGALSEYQGFGFTQYARVGQQLWGCRPDGLYRLGGDVAMDALVDFGTIDLGNQNLKRLSTAFIGVRTDGQVFLRVTTDGVERVYSAVGRDDMRKVQLARGVSARNWSMQLQVTDASYASLDSVEFEIGISQRKTGGRR